jgi:hypothetical protein
VITDTGPAVSFQAVDKGQFSVGVDTLGSERTLRRSSVSSLATDVPFCTLSRVAKLVTM